MLRNELEYRNAKKQIEYLKSELEKRDSTVEGEVSQTVADALKMKIEDIEGELTEYESLKEGLVPTLRAQSFDDVGELIIKARIARGWSQAELAKALDMEQQQVQRYERNDWEKISLWKLQEVVEALGLDVTIHARLHDYDGQSIDPPQTVSSYGGFYSSMISNLGAGIGETLDNFDVRVGEALNNVTVTFGEALVSASMGIGKSLATLPITIKDAVYTTQTVHGAGHSTPQTAHNDKQTVLEGDWDTSGGARVVHLARRRATNQQKVDASAAAAWQQSEAV